MQIKFKNHNGLFLYGGKNENIMFAFLTKYCRIMAYLKNIFGHATLGETTIINDFKHNFWLHINQKLGILRTTALSSMHII